MRLIVVLTCFNKHYYRGMVQHTIPVEYESKQTFLDEFKNAIDEDKSFITFRYKNGNDNNWRVFEFYTPNGEFFPPIVFTVDEFFDGRDESEERTRIKVSGSTNEELN